MTALKLLSVLTLACAIAISENPLNVSEQSCTSELYMPNGETDIMKVELLQTSLHKTVALESSIYGGQAGPIVQAEGRKDRQRFEEKLKVEQVLVTSGRFSRRKPKKQRLTGESAMLIGINEALENIRRSLNKMLSTTIQTDGLDPLPQVNISKEPLIAMEDVQGLSTMLIKRLQATKYVPHVFKPGMLDITSEVILSGPLVGGINQRPVSFDAIFNGSRTEKLTMKAAFLPLTSTIKDIDIVKFSLTYDSLSTACWSSNSKSVYLRKLCPEMARKFEMSFDIRKTEILKELSGVLKVSLENILATLCPIKLISD